MMIQKFGVRVFMMVVMSFGLVPRANAIPIVESFESFSTGTTLTTQVSGLVFSAGLGVPEIRTATNPVIPAEPQGLAHIPYAPSPAALTIDFLTPVFYVGAIVDFGVVGNGVMITAFDGSGGSGNVLGTASTLSEVFISVSASNIQSVRFEHVDGLTVTYLIDNLTYEFVPEPSTGLLLSFGLVGLSSIRRR